MVGDILDEGEFIIPKESLNFAEINYFHQVLRNAKVDQVLFFYIDGDLYIIGESATTYLVGIYKIPIQVTQKHEVTEIEELSDDDLESLFDFDVPSYDLHEDVQGFAGVTEVPSQNTSAEPSTNSSVQDHQVDQSGSTTIKPLHDTIQSTTIVQTIGSTDIAATAPTQTKAIDIPNGEMLAFSTETILLDAITLEENNTDIKVVVNKETVTVQSDNFSLPSFAKVNFIPNLAFYLNVISNKDWEKVNVDSVNRVAKAVTSMKIKDIDTFIAMDHDDIYSDNITILLSAKTWRVQKHYYFGYQTIAAFNKMPANSKSNVFISKADGQILLNYNNIYFAWAEPTERESVNILNLFDIDHMDTLLQLGQKELKKLKCFERILPQKSNDNTTVIFETVTDGTAIVKQDDRFVKLSCVCKPGIQMICDLSFFLRAINLVYDKEVKSATIKANLNRGKVDNILIQGCLDVIIGITGIKKVE